MTLETTPDGEGLFVRHRRRLIAGSQAACSSGMWPIWVQPDAQLLLVASRFYRPGATSASRDLIDRDPVVFVREGSSLGLFPITLPKGKDCLGGTFDVQYVKFFPDSRSFREWRFGGSLPTGSSRLTIDVPADRDLDLRTSGEDARGPLIPFIDRGSERQRVTYAVESLGSEALERDGAQPRSTRPHLFLNLDSRVPPQRDIIAWLDHSMTRKQGIGLVQRSFEAFPTRDRRVHSEVLFTGLYDTTFRMWQVDVDRAFDIWVLAGPPLSERLAYPSLHDVYAVGRARLKGCTRSTATECWDDGVGVLFPPAALLREGPLGEGSLRFLEPSQMRHRPIREFGTVKVISQATATFDINKGWATSGDVTIRRTGRTPEGLGDAWLRSVKGLECERVDFGTQTCALAVGGGRDAYPWVHHLGPLLPMPEHGPRAYPVRNAVGYARTDTIRFVAPSGFTLDWAGPLRIRSPRVQFDLDCVVNGREVSCVRQAEFYSGTMSPEAWSTWLDEWGALESMLRENFQWSVSR